MAGQAIYFWYFNIHSNTQWNMEGRVRGAIYHIEQLAQHERRLFLGYLSATIQCHQEYPTPKVNSYSLWCKTGSCASDRCLFFCGHFGSRRCVLLQLKPWGNARRATQSNTMCQRKEPLQLNTCKQAKYI